MKNCGSRRQKSQERCTEKIIHGGKTLSGLKIQLKGKREKWGGGYLLKGSWENRFPEKAQNGGERKRDAHSFITTTQAQLRRGGPQFGQRENKDEEKKNTSKSGEPEGIGNGNNKKSSRKIILCLRMGWSGGSGRAIQEKGECHFHGELRVKKTAKKDVSRKDHGGGGTRSRSTGGLDVVATKDIGNALVMGPSRRIEVGGVLHKKRGS